MRHSTTVGVFACVTATLFAAYALAAAKPQLSVVYAFQGGADGDWPVSMVFDDAGNLYGTTSYGGSTNCNSGCGTVFKIAADGTKTTLHTFTGYPDDGALSFGLSVDRTVPSMGRPMPVAAAITAPSSSWRRTAARRSCSISPRRSWRRLARLRCAERLRQRIPDFARRQKDDAV